jgi:hypothetical protein
MRYRVAAAVTAAAAAAADVSLQMHELCLPGSWQGGGAAASSWPPSLIHGDIAKWRQQLPQQT